ncbi:hypothetical protein [Siphonobacter sp. SORGH_AS_0500]|uniref:hypothetical protein n=1 Tax=Siphonobacter sp. SORGH_AS_0500 TaxID=1864824 RepID=UPI0028573891|nr:hypothetical protein [Siphonobacter sp. SORGH_AS_0500]MDR6195948.1 hypothetical protein [Siphonobacter sp. SORGH_AS_0500]
MLFPLFIALPGEQVTICLKKRNYSGQVTHASAVDTTGDGAKTRYIVKVAGHDLELNENQIQPKL